MSENLRDKMTEMVAHNRSEVCYHCGSEVFQADPEEVVGLLLTHLREAVKPHIDEIIKDVDSILFDWSDPRLNCRSIKLRCGEILSKLGVCDENTTNKTG